MKRKEVLKEVYILQLISVSVDTDLHAFEQAEDLIESGGCSMIWVRSLEKMTTLCRGTFVYRAAIARDFVLRMV